MVLDRGRTRVGGVYQQRVHDIEDDGSTHASYVINECSQLYHISDRDDTTVVVREDSTNGPEYFHRSSDKARR